MICRFEFTMIYSCTFLPCTFYHIHSELTGAAVIDSCSHIKYSALAKSIRGPNVENIKCCYLRRFQMVNRRYRAHLKWRIQVILIYTVNIKHRILLFNIYYCYCLTFASVRYIILNMVLSFKDTLIEGENWSSALVLDKLPKIPNAVFCRICCGHILYKSQYATLHVLQ